MNWKHIFLRLAGLVVLFVAGIFLYALTVNLLIVINAMPVETTGEGFGILLTHRTIWVAMGMIPVGIAGIFIKQKWRTVLYTAPLYAPALFAIVYTLTQP